MFKDEKKGGKWDGKCKKGKPRIRSALVGMRETQLNDEQVLMVQHTLACRAHGHQPLGHPVNTPRQRILYLF